MYTGKRAWTKSLLPVRFYYDSPNLCNNIIYIQCVNKIKLNKHIVVVYMIW